MSLHSSSHLSAAEQQRRENGAVALALDGIGIGRGQKLARLVITRRAELAFAGFHLRSLDAFDWLVGSGIAPLRPIQRSHAVVGTVPFLTCWGCMSDHQIAQNSLLTALPPTDWETMRKSFQKVDLRHGAVLMEANSPFDPVYFPVSGVVSTVAIMEDGASVEMATVGAEGIIAVGAILGSAQALSRNVVQVPGHALSISYNDFVHWQAAIPAFQSILLSYTQAFIIQVLQSVACNAVHAVQDRAARWLLTCDDRAGGRSFMLTQQFFSEMLGVSRAMVNTVARTFQRAGLIEYRRGVISISDRGGLEGSACECYKIIQNAYEQRGIRLKPRALTL